jgi:hypothetical protein
MKNHSRFAELSLFSQILSLIKRSRCLVAMLLLMAASSGIAQTLYWDQNGATAGTGGAGNWGTASTWRLGSDTGGLQNWDNGGAATAVLGGTGGQVLIDTSLSTGVTMSALNVDSVGYSIRSTAGTRPHLGSWHDLFRIGFDSRRHWQCDGEQQQPHRPHHHEHHQRR